MFGKCLFATTLALIACASHAAANGGKTEAADQGLGMALMSVSYSGTGTVYHSAGAVSVTSIGTGVNHVVFDRNLDGCEFVAGASNAQGTDYASYSVKAKRVAETTIAVTTIQISNGSVVDRPVNVIVFCSG